MRASCVRALTRVGRVRTHAVLEIQMLVDDRRDDRDESADQDRTDENLPHEEPRRDESTGNEGSAFNTYGAAAVGCR